MKIQLCGKPMPKAKNGNDRGACTRQQGHTGYHASGTCGRCGTVLSLANTGQATVRKGSGDCRNCHKEADKILHGRREQCYQKLGKLEVTGFYTYLYLRENWSKDERFPPGSPYYVGKGVGRRVLRKHRVGKHFVYPPKIEYIIIQEWPSEAMAHEGERFLICMYGRKNLGTGGLVNITDGGEGSSGWVPTDETRAKMSDSHTGLRKSPTHRANIGKAHVGMKRSPQARKNMQSAQFKMSKVNSMMETNKGEIIQRYRDGESLLMVASKFLTTADTLRTYFHLWEEPIRSVSKAQKLAYLNGRKSPDNIKKAQQARWEGHVIPAVVRVGHEEGGKKGMCLRWNIRRGKPCTCGYHLNPKI